MDDCPKMVMKVREWKGRKYNTALYRCGCDCLNPGDDIFIEVEYDKEMDQLSLMFYKNIRVFDDHFNKNPFKTFWNRLKKAIRLIFTGYLEMEESFLFEDEEHINNFLCVIKQGRDYVMKEEKE